MAAWTVRYLLFTYGDVQNGLWMLYAGIILHGICYDFFFVTGQIYTDKLAGEKIRSSAQGMITLATYGVGMLIGFWLAGNVANYYKTGANSHAWSQVWVVPAIIALVIAILFALFFKDPTKKLFGSEKGKI
jgi:MFS family permease